MTADIRAAAKREADSRYPGDFSNYLNHYKLGFEDGVVWGAARVTPTREQIVEVLEPHIREHGGSDENDEWWVVDHACDYADAILALMQGLAEGESK